MQLTLAELKIPFAGAACALVAGLALGGAMQPHLDEALSRPAGPQIIAETGGARADGPAGAGVTLAGYHGQTPDYVLGTDWKRAMAWPSERAAVSAPEVEVARDDDPAPEPAVLAHAAYREPPAQPPGYPSLGGARRASDYATDDDTVDADPAG